MSVLTQAELPVEQDDRLEPVSIKVLPVPTERKPLPTLKDAIVSWNELIEAGENPSRNNFQQALIAKGFECKEYWARKFYEDIKAILREQIMTAEAEHEAREAKKLASHRNTEARTKVLTLRQRGAVVPTEKRAAVYALLDMDNRLSNYDIAEKIGYPPSIIQRYMRDWKIRQAEAEQHAL